MTTWWPATWRNFYPGRARPFLLLLTFFWGLTGVGCRSLEPFSGVVKVGLVAPFSGRYYTSGYNFLFAVKMAVAEWNASPKSGVRGYRIELVALDDQGKAALSALQAKKLALDPQVVGVIVFSNSISPLAEDEYRRGELPVVSLTSAAEAQPPAAGPPIIFRLDAPLRVVAQGTASLAAHQLKAQRWAVIVSSLFAADSLEREAKRWGLGVVGSYRLWPGKDPGAVAEELVKIGPEAALFAGPFEEAASLLSRGRWRGPLVAAYTFVSADLLRIAGNATENVYYLSPAPHPRDLPEAQPFAEKYRTWAREGGWEAEPDAYTLMAYDATNLLLSALDESIARGSPPSRPALAEALSQITFSGLTGPISFDGRGQRRDPTLYVYRLLGYPGELVAIIPGR